MSRRPARFTECDLKRAMSAVEKAGSRFEIVIEPDGVIRLVPKTAETATNQDHNRPIEERATIEL